MKRLNQQPEEGGAVDAFGFSVCRFQVRSPLAKGQRGVFDLATPDDASIEPKFGNNERRLPYFESLHYDIRMV
jgi:hypothetical protein